MNPGSLKDVEKGNSPENQDSPPATPRSASSSQTLASIWTNLSFRRLLAPLKPVKQYMPGVFSSDSVVSSDAASSDEEPGVRQVHLAPNGYPKLATFLDSEDQFSMYRRFGYLASRLILEKQDDLRQLEDDLEDADISEEKHCPERLKTRQCFQGYEPTQQRILLEKIEVKFLEYCNILRNAREFAGCNKPTTREWKAVQTWLSNVDPLYDDEQRFAKYKEDLVTLRSGREHAWLDGAVEWLIRSLRCPPVTWLFQSNETRRKSNGENGERYVTRSRVEFAANMLLTLMILALLVVPVYLLFYLTNKESQTATKATNSGGGEQPPPAAPRRFDGIDATCIGILLVSTLAFSATVTLFTSARRQEIIGASAAYCAVLVVFIGNLGESSGVAAQSGFHS